MNLESLDKYLLKITPRRHPVLAAMERYARRRHFPIIGPLAGRLLYQIAALSRARRVLELGSGFGYSALWFALAMDSKGVITLTDTDPANRTRAMEYFRRAALKIEFDFRLGNALQIASGLRSSFDIVLNDVDKEDYPATIDIAARLLRPGGVFVSDNLLWGGRVMHPQLRDLATAGIRRFTRRLYADPRFFVTVLPLRDGIALALRK